MKRSVLLAVLVWVAVVAAASTLTWAVISSAGQQALSSGQAPTPDLPPQSPSPTATAPSDPSSRPAPTYVERVWKGGAGTVAARCTGERLDLRSATPNDQYHVEVQTSGGRELEVKFESEADEVKVRGSCLGGVPRFDVESRSEEGD